MGILLTLIFVILVIIANYKLINNLILNFLLCRLLMLKLFYIEQWKGVKMFIIENYNMVFLFFLVLILLTIFLIMKIVFDKFKDLNSKIDVIDGHILENSKKLDVIDKYVLENSKKLNNIVEQILESNKNIKLNNENILNTSMELKNAIKQDFVIFNNDIKLSTSSIEDKVENYIKSQDKNAINVGTKLDNYFTNITKIISTLKIDNLISITNEVNKYRQGILEDEFFLQEVGHCKIIKFTDKSNNDFTEVFYNDSGEKLYAETYSEDKLKFLIKYQNDKIKDGIEFDKDGNVIFEYFYNEAEEISKKIEYEYHNNGKRIKEEVNY